MSKELKENEGTRKTRQAIRRLETPKITPEIRTITREKFVFPNPSGPSGIFGPPAQQTTGIFGQPPENKGLFGNTNNTMTGFGQQSAFGAATSQPSAGGLFNKPFAAAPTTSTSGFGFGNTANNASSNLFGAKPFGQPVTGSVFGAAQPNAGAPSAFGQPNTGFGGFGQPNANQAAPLFGQTADKPASGFTFGIPQAAAAIFGQDRTSNATSGQEQSASNFTFGVNQSVAFGVPTGTGIVKYKPSLGTVFMMINKRAKHVTTKYYCITAMKEYLGKSLEELRLEDYLANRKGSQTITTKGIFGCSFPSAPSGLFGSSAQHTTGTEEKFHITDELKVFEGKIISLVDKMRDENKGLRDKLMAYEKEVKKLNKIIKNLNQIQLEDNN